MTAPIKFWFSIASTYTYLSVSRIADVIRQTGIELRYKPFSVRSIMVEQNNIPFRTKPVKLAYMWRDIERRAALYGLPFAGLAPYPLKDFRWLTALLSSERERDDASSMQLRFIVGGSLASRM